MSWIVGGYSGFSGLIPSEVLQPLHSLCRTSSLEWTPKRPPSVYRDVSADTAATETSSSPPTSYFTYPPLALSSATFRSTEDRTLQAILSRFYSCATTCPPSPPIATVAPCCLLIMAFPDFVLATKRELLWVLRIFSEINITLISQWTPHTQCLNIVLYCI